MIDKEKEIVNKEFIKRTDTYNYAMGGFGLSTLGDEMRQKTIEKIKISNRNTDKTIISKKRIETMLSKNPNIFNEIGKMSSIKQKLNYKNGYVNPNQNNDNLNIYNSGDELMYTCKRINFSELCNKHDLPERVLLKSLHNKGIPLYYEKQPTSEKYIRYVGWYALYENASRIDLNEYYEKVKERKRKYSKKLSEYTCFNDNKNRYIPVAKNSYEIYDNNDNLRYCISNKNVKKELIELNLPVNSFLHSYRKAQKIRLGLYKDWYMVRL